MATTQPMVKETIPSGTLKQVKLSDIKWELHRYRADFGNLEHLAESIRQKGVLQPVTLRPDMSILAGERRIKAAILAGLEKIPALVRQIDGEVDAREIELIENTFRKDFEWQEEVALVAEIDRLYKEKNLDWSGRKTAELLSKGKSSVGRALQLAEASSVLPELLEQRTADDAFKMLKKFEETAVIDELRRRQQAQISADPAMIAEHQERGLIVMSDDIKVTLRAADMNYQVQDTFLGLAELRAEGVVHLIECDPPYGIDLRAVKGSKDSVDSNVHDYEEISAEAYPHFLQTLTKELFRVAGKDCWLIFWYGPTWHTEVRVALKEAGWLVDDIPAVWTKRQGQTLQPELYLARGYEPFFLCRKGQPYMAKRGRLNVFDFPGVPSAQKYHPTERPMELMQELLSTLGAPRQIILVPFLGSGVTLRAAYASDMLAFGFDMNKGYKDQFLLRVEEDAKARIAAKAV